MDTSLLLSELRECLAEAEWMLQQVELTKKAMDADEPWGEYAVSYAEIRTIDLRSIEALKHVFPPDSPVISAWFVHEMEGAFTLKWHIKDFQSKIGLLRSAIRSVNRQVGSPTQPSSVQHPPQSTKRDIEHPPKTDHDSASATQPRLRVFLCHASADKPAVRPLYDHLVSDGYEVWFDETNLLPGQDWQHEISRAVKQSDVFLACLSAHSVSKAGYVQREIRFALDVADERPEGAIFVVPVRLEECGMPERLARWHWVDLFSNEGYQRLTAALSSVAARM
jgi:hypothetical protein